MADRRLRADARDNHSKILQAARTAFDELGPDANLRDIARRAGVSQGTVHRHFPTKEALFSAIAAQRLTELTALARSVRAEHTTGSTPAADALFSFLTATVHHARHNRSLASVFAGAAANPAVSDAEHELSAELGTLLEQAQSERAIRPDVDLGDVHAIAAALLALDASSATSDADRARRVTVVLDGLRSQRR